MKIKEAREKIIKEEIILDTENLPNLWRAQKSGGNHSQENLEKRLYALAGEKVVWRYDKYLGNVNDTKCLCGVRITHVYKISNKDIACCIGSDCIEKFYKDYLGLSTDEFERVYITEQLDRFNKDKKKIGRKTMDCDNCGKKRIKKSEKHGICEKCDGKVENCIREKRCSACLWKYCKKCDKRKENKYNYCYTCFNNGKNKCANFDCRRVIKDCYTHCWRC